MKKIQKIPLLLFGIIATTVSAQTDVDAIMMAKRNLCGGFLVGTNSWTNYWEGKNYRDNDNIGVLKSNSIMAMVNYGISDKLNLITAAPYISNSASKGTLRGQEGFQDLSLTVKYEFLSKKFRNSYISLLAFGNFSTPLTDYVADYLPLAIGNQSNTLTGKLMGDFQRGRWFATASVAYTNRSNVTIDRDAYYTTEMIYSNEVQLPSVFGFNGRMGYRKDADFIVEAVFDQMNTLGGFDMRKNEMPFLSNNMDMSRIGLNFKLPIPKVNALSLLGNVMYTVSGRNVGRSTLFMTGLVYQVEFTKRTKS